MVMEKIFSKVRMLISILGPDGCGKTTIAEKVVSLTNEKGQMVAIHKATLFGIMPTFSYFKVKLYGLFGCEYRNKHEHKEGELLAGMKHKPNSFLKSTLLLFWYSLDYFLGTSLVKEAKEHGKLIIFARYYYDFYYQRVHLNLPPLLIRALELIVPTPDIIIFLKRDPEAIFKIKPELSVLEIQRQNDSIESSLGGRGNFYKLDNNCSINDTIKEVLEIIESKS